MERRVAGTGPSSLPASKLPFHHARSEKWQTDAHGGPSKLGTLFGIKGGTLGGAGIRVEKRPNVDNPSNPRLSGTRQLNL